jgi:hypothetical protein
VKGSYEHGNEPAGSINFWEVLEQFYNWRLFKWDSVPWSVTIGYLSPAHSEPSSEENVGLFSCTQLHPTVRVVPFICYMPERACCM